jgi:hypothetical protein
VGFYRIQRIHWVIIFSLQSHWEVPSYGNRCGNKSRKNLTKEKNISNYSRTVNRTLFVVSELLHFLNNNTNW